MSNNNAIYDEWVVMDASIIEWAVIEAARRYNLNDPAFARCLQQMSVARFIRDLNTFTSYNQIIRIHIHYKQIWESWFK